METIYDWLSVILFCAIAVTYLERSVRPIEGDPIIRYLPPAIGCALANWLGNNGFAVPAIATLLLTLIYFLKILRPLRNFIK